MGQFDWGEQSHSFALSTSLHGEGLFVYLILNAYWEPLDFELPLPDHPEGKAWHRWIDTSRPSPEDIVPWETAPVVDELTYRAGPRSVVVLFEQL